MSNNYEQKKQACQPGLPAGDIVLPSHPFKLRGERINGDEIQPLGAYEP